MAKSLLASENEWDSERQDLKRKPTAPAGTPMKNASLQPHRTRCSSFSRAVMIAETR